MAEKKPLELGVSIYIKLKDPNQYGREVFSSDIQANSFEEARKLLDKVEQLMALQETPKEKN